MSSEKREFTDFANFPGEIQKSGIYEFPTLYHNSATGKVRQWTIFVRLIKSASKLNSKEPNWNLLSEDQVPIKQQYLEDDAELPSGILSQVWTESGFINMKITRSAASYPEIKNKGKKNERNVLHQALVQARGDYLKKLRAGGKPDIPNHNTKVTKKYFPMLARNYKDLGSKLVYPVYVQPKLDGLRCLIYLDKNPAEHKDHSDITEQDVILYTRDKLEFPINHTTKLLKSSLLQTLIDNYDEKKGGSIYLDGELYKHGVSLQKINSMMRKEDLTHSTKNFIEYNLFDLFYPDIDQTFEERNVLLQKIHSTLDNDAKKIVQLVPTELAKSRDVEDSLFAKNLKSGYEGSIIRDKDGIYAKGSIKSSTIRSKALLKRKPVFDEEFEVVGFTQGTKGKDVGALIWICSTKNDIEFNVVPNMTYEERYALYKECLKKFDTKYKNRMLTVEFRGLSDDKVPQHAKAIGFRIDPVS